MICIGHDAGIILTQAAGDDLGAVLGEDEGVNQRQVHGGAKRCGVQGSVLAFCTRAGWHTFSALRPRRVQSLPSEGVVCGEALALVPSRQGFLFAASCSAPGA